MMKDINEFCDYSGLTTDGNYVWYISPGNLLFEINISNGLSKLLGAIPCAKNIDYSFRTLVYVDESLFLLPFQSQVLVKYDLNENKFILIDYPKELIKAFGNGYLNLFGGYVCQDNVIMYGTNHFIIKYDYKKSVFSWKDALEFCKHAGIGVRFWNDGFCIGKVNYYPIAGHRAITIENLSTGKTNLLTWGNYCEENQTITKAYRNKICFVAINNDWNIKIEIIDPNYPEKYELLIDEQVESSLLCYNDEPPFVCGDVVGDKLILYPAHNNILWIVDLETGYIRKSGICNGNGRYKRIKCFNSINVGDDKALSILSNENKLIVYNDITEELLLRQIVLDDDSVERIKREYSEILKNYGIVREQSSIITLKTFLEWV